MGSASALVIVNGADVGARSQTNLQIIVPRRANEAVYICGKTDRGSQASILGQHWWGMAVATDQQGILRPVRHGLRPRARFYVLSAVLLLVTVAVYWPVHTHAFAPDDDYFYIVDNAQIHNGLTWQTVTWAFTATNMVNWIPVTWLSHALDYQLFGLNASGHHVTNLLLHAIAAWLLFWMLHRATGYLGRSFMVAALFALHPINVEAVAWVAERKTMLSMIFFVLALAAYRWYVSQPGIARYAVVAACYSLGLMAKSQIIMLPFVLLLWDYWPLQRMLPTEDKVVEGTNAKAPMPGRSFYRLIEEKFPLFGIALFDAAITLRVQGTSRQENWDYTLATRLANALVAYSRYIGKALWPEWLGPHYPHAGNGLPIWQVVASSLLLIAITAAVLAAKRQRYLAVGWLWFVISMVPMSGIVPFGSQALADRYAYQPFCGLFLLICWSVAEWGDRMHLPRPVLTSTSVAVLAALAVLTYRQVNLWGDDLALWTHALQVSADNSFTEDRVGTDLLARGRSREALQHFRQAVQLDAGDPLGNLQLAFYEHQHGNLQEAADYYERVVHGARTTPNEKRRALINLGHVYGTLGNSDKAQACFAAAAKVPPEASSH